MPIPSLIVPGENMARDIQAKAMITIRMATIGRTTSRSAAISVRRSTAGKRTSPSTRLRHDSEIGAVAPSAPTDGVSGNSPSGWPWLVGSISAAPEDPPADGVVIGSKVSC